MSRLTLSVLSLAFLAGCQPGIGPLTNEDKAALRSLEAAYAQAELAGDANGIAECYADNGIEMLNMTAAVGKDSIRERHAEAFQNGMDASEFTITAVEIDGLNGLAYVRGTWSWTGTVPPATEPITDGGKYLSIARRQEDGSWLWTAVIWNSDTPPPQPE
jgi:uncharacterized protein (TIGR02246 family)